MLLLLQSALARSRAQLPFRHKEQFDLITSGHTGLSLPGSPRLTVATFQFPERASSPNPVQEESAVSYFLIPLGDPLPIRTSPGLGCHRQAYKLLPRARGLHSPPTPGGSGHPGLQVTQMAGGGAPARLGSDC